MKVFLSSTYTELKEYRETVRSRLEKLEIPGVTMECFGSDESAPLKVSLKRLEECDIYIGIIGHTYGSTPPGETRSYTRCEYEQAVKLMREGRMRLLIYLADDEIRLPAELLKKGTADMDKQDEFRQKLKDKHTTGFFDNANDLGQQVTTDLFKLYRDNKLPADETEEVQLFDVGNEEMIRKNFDSAARESLDKIRAFIDFIARSFGELFKLDAVSLDTHPFFRRVNAELAQIIPGISLNDKGGILERADVRHVILRANTIISLITRIHEDERAGVGKEIGAGAASDLIQNIIEKGKLVPISAEAFISLWNFWDRTGGWGTLELVESLDKENAGQPGETLDKPEWWYLKITNNFLRKQDEPEEEVRGRNKFWCGYIHGFLDTALPRITERMNGLSDARRPEVTFPEYYRVASVGPHFVEGESGADVFRVVFEKEIYSAALQAVSESQKRLKKEDYFASMTMSRSALLAAREVVGKEEFYKSLEATRLSPNNVPIIKEILSNITPPMKMVNRDKAGQWFTAVNDLIQQLTKC